MTPPISDAQVWRTPRTRAEWCLVSPVKGYPGRWNAMCVRDGNHVCDESVIEVGPDWILLATPLWLWPMSGPKRGQG